MVDDFHMILLINLDSILNYLCLFRFLCYFFSLRDILRFFQGFLFLVMLFFHLLCEIIEVNLLIFLLVIDLKINFMKEERFMIFQLDVRSFLLEFISLDEVFKNSALLLCFMTLICSIDLNLKVFRELLREFKLVLYSCCFGGRHLSDQISFAVVFQEKTISQDQYQANHQEYLPIP